MGRFEIMTEKPAIDRYARSTAETTDEYAEHRIKNCESKERLEAIQDEEVKAGPRQKRMAWINQTLARIQ